MRMELTYPVVISIFRDDFQKYLLSPTNAGDLSFVVDNLPIALGRDLIMLFGLNEKWVDFHLEVADIVVDHLNYLFQFPFEVYDAHIKSHRKILVRLNRRITDTIEQQEFTRTNIHGLWGIKK